MQIYNFYILLQFAGLAIGAKYPVTGVFQTAKNITESVANGVMSSLPKPQDIFEGSKQLLLGYPTEAISDVFNKICSTAISSNAVAPKISPNIQQMKFQFRTKCQNYSVPLLKSDELWHYEHFDPTKKVVILATGWTTTINDSSTIDEFAKAYNCRNDVNFVALDAASFVDTLYTWSALNTEELGKYMAEGLAKLVEIVPLENIHLIGHSLGAHIVGAAGRHFYYLTNRTIPRITGLDAAKPCFNEGEALSGLLRGDADFIDAIHSNPGVLGKRQPIGDVDFYPGGLSPLPPGCLDIFCAHARAWQYYVESVYPGNENNFIGTRCTSLNNLNKNKCGNYTAIMGYAASPDRKGNYFLNIFNKSPFGMNSNMERMQKMENCGLCPNPTSSSPSSSSSNKS